MGKNNKKLKIFISCCTTDNDTKNIADAFEKYIKKHEKDSMEVIGMSDLKEDPDIDTILKLYSEIKNCDLVIHFVGIKPGAVANEDAIFEFYEREVKEEKFISDNSGFKSSLKAKDWKDVYRVKFPEVKPTYPQLKAYRVKGHFNNLKKITYTQWEAYLAIHLRKKIFVYGSEKAIRCFGTNSSDRKINNPFLRSWWRVRSFSACVFNKELAIQKKHVGALNAGRYKLIGYIDSSTILGNIKQQIPSHNGRSKVKTEFNEKIIDLLKNNREDFIGRQWIIDAIDDWIKNDNRKVLFITGDPGIGKSAIVLHLFNRLRDDQEQAKLNNIELKSNMLACHFCQSGDDPSLRRWTFIQNVAAMIQERFPEVGGIWDDDWDAFKNEYETDPVTAFLIIIRTLPYPASDPNEEFKFYILIDALDEALTENNTFSYRNNESIVHLLDSTLNEFPHWLRICRNHT